MRYCARRTGIGADGLLAMSDPVSEEANLRMQYFNADGSEGMCGNGARCLVAYAWQAEIRPDIYFLETTSGMYRASIDHAGIVTLFVPEPRDVRPDLQFDEPKEGRKGTYIWTGTDHVVMFVDDLNGTDVSGIGRAVRNSSVLSPKGANVNFVETGELGATDIAVNAIGVYIPLAFFIFRLFL